MGRESMAQPSKEKGKQVEKAKDKGKAIAKPKKKSDVQVRSRGPLVINEGGSKKKKPLVEHESESDNEDEPDRSEEEEESVDPWVKQYEPEAVITECLEALEKCTILQTRWIDVDLLKRLGILEDVRMVLGCMGLGKLLEMDYVCYPEQTRELIASFHLRLRKDAKTPSELGRVVFRCDNKWREVSISALCDAYGFPQKLGREFQTSESKERRIWRLVGKGEYTRGRTKANRIGNPAIRYVHKVLANTLCARYETDRIIEDDMALISNGIQPLFREHYEDEGIEGYEDMNLGVLLARKIIYLKSWAKKEQRNKSMLLICGFLTPLLKAAKVRLRKPCKGPMLKLDFKALKRMRFLDGKDGSKVLYRFVGSDLADHTVLLPNEEITSINSLENLLFTSAEDMDLISTAPAEALLSMRDEEDQETRRTSPDLPLGSPRYYFSPYKGKVRGQSSEYTLDTLKKSQRWHKWSARSIHNIKRSCKKKVRALEDQLSGLKSMIETYVFKKKSPPTREDGEVDFDVAMEEARRHSTSHLPSSSSRTTVDPPRSSYQQAPSQRKKRLRHVTTPSPGSSDNQSLHLTSSEEEDSN